ncbi:hypothetical protein GJ496_004319 [Pomphorhynchus laevis]|nr:hypothetical protein GJ496_004319 [Pomphorhynchus laevis]
MLPRFQKETFEAWKLVLLDQLNINNEDVNVIKDCVTKLQSPIARVVRDGLNKFIALGSLKNPSILQIAWSLLYKDSTIRRSLLRIMKINPKEFISDEDTLCSNLHSLWTHRDEHVRHDGLLVLDILLKSKEIRTLPQLHLLECLLKSCAVVSHSTSLVNTTVDLKLQIASLIQGLLMRYLLEKHPSFDSAVYEDDEYRSELKSNDNDSLFSLKPIKFSHYVVSRRSDIADFEQLCPEILSILDGIWNTLKTTNDNEYRLHKANMIIRSIHDIIDIVCDPRQTIESISDDLFKRLHSSIMHYCVDLPFSFQITKTHQKKRLTNLNLLSIELLLRYKNGIQLIQHTNAVCYILDLIINGEMTAELTRTLNIILNHHKLKLPQPFRKLFQEQILSSAQNRHNLSNERLRSLELIKFPGKFHLLCETISAYLSAEEFNDKFDRLLTMLTQCKHSALKSSVIADIYITYWNQIPVSSRTLALDLINVMPYNADTFLALRNIMICDDFPCSHINRVMSNLQQIVLSANDDKDVLHSITCFLYTLFAGHSSSEYDSLLINENCDNKEAIHNLWNQPITSLKRHLFICKAAITYLGVIHLITIPIHFGLLAIFKLFPGYNQCLMNVPPNLVTGHYLLSCEISQLNSSYIHKRKDLIHFDQIIKECNDTHESCRVNKVFADTLALMCKTTICCVLHYEILGSAIDDVFEKTKSLFKNRMP